MKMSPIRCVAFDFDGVLVDSNVIKRHTFYDVFSSRGMPTSIVTRCLESAGEGDRHDVIACVVRSSGHQGTAASTLIEACVFEYSRQCEEQIAVCPERAGASDTLRLLAALLPLYINSATPQDALVSVVARRGWTPYFRNVLGRPNGKAENLERVLDVERLTAQELLFVGDLRTDQVSAARVGCQFLGLESDESDFDGPVQLAHTLHDVAALVLKSWER
jgi:phosphoglycolate phosphatase-like HAD superfamily hydrolase